ncbi:MAG TPA: metallophosphoesterase [Thermodesulfobacteriota bacterium]
MPDGNRVGVRPASAARRTTRGACLIAVLLASLVALGCARRPAPPRHAGATELAAWVELGPSGVALARVITARAACPAVALESGSLPMRVRAGPSEPAFPVLVCEAPIPPGTRSASVGGQRLPLPKADPQRIVVLGDTGCRLKVGHEIQACNDPRAWPFAQVARGAAAWRPDLVIDTGDYLYRELACPSGNAGCAGSPWGDTWAAWDADFFTPAAPLLRAAPWVVARGDHELCSRAGEGWFRFLDPRAAPTRCQDYTEPYAVPIGTLTVLVMDTADADDEDPAAAKVAAYAEQFAALREMARGSAWLVMHKPLWGLRPAPAEGGRQTLTPLNPTLIAASRGGLPRGVTQVVSGHVHLFETLGFADGRPPQFVVGTGGTELDPDVSAPLSGQALAGTTVTSGRAIARFGFTTMEPASAGWVVTWRDVDGTAQTTCTVRGARVSCIP